MKRRVKTVQKEERRRPRRAVANSRNSQMVTSLAKLQAQVLSQMPQIPIRDTLNQDSPRMLYQQLQKLGDLRIQSKSNRNLLYKWCKTQARTAR